MVKYMSSPNSWFPLFRSRFGRWNIFRIEVINQLFRLLRSPKVFRLTTVGIETNNTCNLKCKHCPTNTSMRRAKGLITWELFQQIIDNNPEVKRVYLTNWGEPLLHPQIGEMINYARRQGKVTALTTNGTLLTEKTSREILRAGLDILKISIDGDPVTYEKVRGFSYSRVEKNVLNFIHLRDTLGAKTWVEVSMLVFPETIPAINSFFHRWEKKVNYVQLQPKFFTFPRQKVSSCRDLWRFLVVLWDGRIVPCCADVEGELELGHAAKHRLQAVFRGPQMNSLRAAHLQQKAPKLCQTCLPYFTDYHLSVKKLCQLVSSSNLDHRQEGHPKKETRQL